MSNKQNIRNHIRSKRLSVPLTYRKNASNQLFLRVIKNEFFQKAQHIAFYFSDYEEIDPCSIMKESLKNEQNCYLPFLDKPKLKFVPYHLHDQLIVNNYGIFEPKNHTSISPEELDVIFVPLVAFDEKLNRLGRGGGFYDHTLQFKRSRSKTKPLLVGLSFDFQKVESLKTEPWDISLDMIITEEKSYKL